MKKPLVFAILVQLSLMPSLVRSAEGNDHEEDLSALVSKALANNPELKASEARWQMFASKSKQVKSLDDPMVMFKLQNMLTREPGVFNLDPTSAKVVAISQQLPFWGKRAVREKVALNEAESYKWAFEERKLELTKMVKENYYQLWAVNKMLVIIDKNLKILSNFLTINELKYSVGQGMQQDIYKAGLEKSKMLDMQITLKQQRKSLEANLNYLTYRSGNTPIGTVADFTLPRVTLSREQLNETALNNRPQVKNLTSLVNKAKSSRSLAKKEAYPDFNLSAEYMFREPIATGMATDPGYNMFSVGLSFNLPIQQQKRRAMVAESAFETTMATEELNALKNSISYTIDETLAQLDRRRQQVELYSGGIIPQSGQSLESALISYRVNKVDFLTLLDSRMNLFNYERELYESKAEYMMKIAQLEAMVGSEVTLTPAAPASEHHEHFNN
ncbi:MAG: TolC family protein [Chlorobium sp.]|jgi:outer membrane protein, heavy metal efflux system|nr:MAG: TolC family protein [Chlorobium sp.]